MDRFPLGYNTYSIRALRWHDLQLIEYATAMKLDAILLQDSIDPGINDPAHWKAVKDAAARPGCGWARAAARCCRRTTSEFDRSVKLLRDGDQTRGGHGVAAGAHAARGRSRTSASRAAGEACRDHDQGAARGAHAGDGRGREVRDRESQGPALLGDAPGDRGAGKEFVGSYLDTGNPVFVMEDPMQTVETLGPLAVMLHLRDSVVYEIARSGIAVQWVPLGEGVVDFKAIVAKAREICPPLAVFIKPITGRPPAILPVWDAAFMKKYADVRAADFARFLALAKKGGPYERHMVIEDVPGRRRRPLTAALTYQQREHMERGVEYGKKVLDLGVRWRVG